ncbi:Hypothetical_protein [Hexamita inflata]|uniref:Hypothetical_protein n=1 Tax=Hexamita inflata TaxID=28002 RepID=A0ABP1JED4_9EUKA
MLIHVQSQRANQLVAKLLKDKKCENQFLLNFIFLQIYALIQSVHSADYYSHCYSHSQNHNFHTVYINGDEFAKMIEILNTLLLLARVVRQSGLGAALGRKQTNNQIKMICVYFCWFKEILGVNIWQTQQTAQSKHRTEEKQIG